MTPAPLGIVAGSGIELRPLLDAIERETTFDALGLCAGTVAGHDCRYIEGRYAGHPVVLQCGRLHAYEGLSFESIARTVDILRDLGVRTVVFTNAVGGLHPEMRPGSLVAATEIRPWPYGRMALPEALKTDFLPDGCDFSGSYRWMHGPCYETRAEIAALQRLGDATVGMSTAPELHQCHELGLRAAVISCVTNNCTVLQILTHEHVVQTAREASERLRGLLREFVVIRAGEQQKNV